MQNHCEMGHFENAKLDKNQTRPNLNVYKKLNYIKLADRGVLSSLLYCFAGLEKILNSDDTMYSICKMPCDSTGCKIFDLNTQVLKLSYFAPRS